MLFYATIVAVGCVDNVERKKQQVI